MALLPKALCMFGVLLAVCLQFSNSHRLPLLCKCGTTISKFHPQNIEDFTIDERTDRCGTEILLRTNLPRAPVICLDPRERQGQKFLNCWTNTIQRDESRKAECLRRAPKPTTGVETRTEAGNRVTKELLFPTSTPRSTPTTTSS